MKRILIANRGEIAVRIIRACRELGKTAIAIYSEPDRSNLHVRMADEAYDIGPARAVESYLAQEKIIAKALEVRADAIHPGYGFLAENPGFARKVHEAGLTFIGPPPECMELAGNKIEARRTAEKAGVPVVQGSQNSLKDWSEASRVAARIGYPIMLKAAAGGGGKGMRLVHSENELQTAWKAARGEALSAFNDERLYLEKALSTPRHIEMQILADSQGHGVWLGERECSIQRRHQKIIEESPSPVVDEVLRAKLGEYAVRLAQTMGYTNAGTMEFLLDNEGNIYFLEVNARIQVEHPVTEMVTGLDLVSLQILIAEGSPIPFLQDQVTLNGHAIECRVYAEDPHQGFIPCPGRITSIRSPGGPFVREDSGIYPGWEVPWEYDPMLSKVIAWGATRYEAMIRMKRALEEYQIHGVATTLPLCRAVLADPEFQAGRYDTGYIERFLSSRLDFTNEDTFVALLASAVAHFDTRTQSRDRARKVSNSEDPWLIAAREAAKRGSFESIG